MARRNREEETEDSVNAADERAIKELEKAEKPEKPQPRVSTADTDDDDDEFEVGAEDDDDDDVAPAQRPSRQQRRQERGNNREQQWQEQLAEARKDAAEQRALFAALINGQQQQRQAPATPQVDPEEAKLNDEIKGLEKQRRALIDRHQTLQANKQLTQEQHDRMQDEDFELRQSIAKAQHKLFAPRQQQGMSPQQIQAMGIQQRMQMDHGDVVGRPTAFAFYQATYREAREKGAPESWETVEKAMAKARQLAGLPPKGGRPAPSAGTRAKFEGAPRGGGAGGAGGGRAVVKMTAQVKELADAAYPHIKDEKKRYQHYANVHGKSKAFQGA